MSSEAGGGRVRGADSHEQMNRAWNFKGGGGIPGNPCQRTHALCIMCINTHFVLCVLCT